MEVKDIPISKITISDLKVRKNLDTSLEDNSLDNLAESIRKNGLLNPITVIQKGDLYELVVGKRRFLACQSIGLDTIPAIVRDDISDADGRTKDLMAYSKKIVFDEKPPKPEDFEREEEYDEALEKFINNVPRDRPISEEVYVVYTNYFGYEHLKDHFFKICDKEYYAAVHVLPDDLSPDSTNTRIFIVAKLANE